MKIESLRLHLLCWLLVPLAGVAAFNVWSSYDTARATADMVTDRTLLASARSIAEQTSVEQGVIDAQVPPAALEMFSTGHGDRVYYRVQGSDGRLFTGYPDLPLPVDTRADSQPRYYWSSYRDQPLRLIALSHPVVGAGEASPILVVVGATLNSRAALMRDLWTGAFGQQAALLLGAAILVLLGTNRGLAPLMRLRDAVLQRRQDQLEPFSAASVQSELRPLVAALNLYMSRVQQQMAAQRRFVANAAHQLKTPLTLLNTQATFALRTHDRAELEDALKALQASTRQTARLASQLLTLARAEPGSRRPRRELVDIVEAARQVLGEFTGVALQRGLDLGLEDAAGPALVAGDGAMIREMIVNLVDNAVRYTPAGGAVLVAVERAGGICVLRVADNGRGIPAEERERVFERFYRVLGTEEEGSGLGLAIVKEICEAAGGSVALRDPPSGHGLTVEVSLPAAGAEKEATTEPGARVIRSPAR